MTGTVLDTKGDVLPEEKEREADERLRVAWVPARAMGEGLRGPQEAVVHRVRVQKVSSNVPG